MLRSCPIESQNVQTVWRRVEKLQLIEEMDFHIKFFFKKIYAFLELVKFFSTKFSGSFLYFSTKIYYNNGSKRIKKWLRANVFQKFQCSYSLFLCSHNICQFTMFEKSKTTSPFDRNEALKLHYLTVCSQTGSISLCCWLGMIKSSLCQSYYTISIHPL